MCPLLIFEYQNITVYKSYHFLTPQASAVDKDERNNRQLPISITLLDLAALIDLLIDFRNALKGYLHPWHIRGVK